MSHVIVVTGASSGFGLMTARALAHAGHTVYAGMRETAGRNAPQAAGAEAYARQHGIDLRTVELDVASEASVEAAIGRIIARNGRLDVVVHNAGHMVYGPAEAFTPEQLAQLYDVNVLSTQRVNRAALPQLRKQGRGLLVWVSSSSTRGGTPPYLAPYFAAKAGMDALAVSYAGELARWGIETSIIVPGAFTRGTNHFAHSGTPADTARAEEYAKGPTADSARSPSRAWRRWSRRMPTRRRWPTPSSRWSTRPSASGRSGCISTRRRTAPRSSTASPTGSGPSCCAGSGSRTS